MTMPTSQALLPAPVSSASAISIPRSLASTSSKAPSIERLASDHTTALPSITVANAEEELNLESFVSFVISKAKPEKKHELSKWFYSPLAKDDEVDKILDPVHKTIRYRSEEKRPLEIRRDEILKTAEDYYHKSQWRASVTTACILRILFYLPALPLYLLKRAYDLVIEKFTAPSETKSENETLLRGSFRFSLKWALYVVFVVFSVRFRSSGGFKGLLLPSTSPAFRNDLAESRKKGSELVKRKLEYRNRMHRIWKQATIWQEKAAEEFEDYCRSGILPEPPYKDAKFQELERTLHERQKYADEYQRAVENADRDIKRIKDVAKTEACTNATGYKGVADWAQDAHASYWNLMQVISGVCFLGAGLTYAAIFGAVRGNIGLMSWAFGLFICALAVLVAVQSLLLWCTRLENYPFSTPPLWEVFLGFAVYGSCALVIGAIGLLVVTVMELRFDVASAEVVSSLAVAAASGNNTSIVPCPTGRYNPKMFVMNDGSGRAMCNLDAFGGGYVPGDAHLTFSVDTQKPAIVAFSYLAAGVGVAILVLLLFSAANGLDMLLFRRSMERTKMPRVGLKDLECGGPWEEPKKMEEKS